jgi:hypothetical protein
MKIEKNGIIFIFINYIMNEKIINYNNKLSYVYNINKSK